VSRFSSQTVLKKKLWGSLEHVPAAAVSNQQCQSTERIDILTQVTTDRTDKKAQHNQCTVFNKARFFLTDFWSHLTLCLGGQSQHRGHGSHLSLVEIGRCHETCPTDLHISQALNTASSSDDDKITFYYYAYIQEYNKRINKWSKKFDKKGRIATMHTVQW